jgi:hypothetical protein
VTHEELGLVLGSIASTPGEDGFQNFPEGCTATLQIAKDGVGLTVSRAIAVKESGGQLQVRTEKGETSYVSLSDVFACTVDAGKGRSARRAGFGS